MEQNPQGVKPMTWVIAIVVIIVLVILGIWLFGSKSSTPATTETPATTDDTTAAAVNRVVVSDQFPGNVVYLSSVQLAQGGFVAIQKDNAGTPGAVIGSAWFDKGINPGKITLSQSTVEGGTYYAVMYNDTDGDMKFDATKDMPLKDANGNVIMKVFKATATATEVKG
jgi:cytoskeletal protein RodZ